MRLEPCPHCGSQHLTTVNQKRDCPTWGQRRKCADGSFPCPACGQLLHAVVVDDPEGAYSMVADVGASEWHRCPVERRNAERFGALVSPREYQASTGSTDRWCLAPAHDRLPLLDVDGGRRAPLEPEEWPQREALQPESKDWLSSAGWEKPPREHTYRWPSARQLARGTHMTLAEAQQRLDAARARAKEREKRERKQARRHNA